MGKVNALSPILTEIKPRVVILDGAIGQFREEYLGRGTLADRQMQIARLMTHIKNISYYFRCTVVFTNQVQSDPAMMFGDPIKPIGGNIVGMSTFPEYLMCKKLNIKPIILSCITNYGAGIKKDSINHYHVIKNAKKSKSNFNIILTKIIKKLN